MKTQGDRANVLPPYALWGLAGPRWRRRRTSCVRRLSSFDRQAMYKGSCRFTGFSFVSMTTKHTQLARKWMYTCIGSKNRGAKAQSKDRQSSRWRRPAKEHCLYERVRRIRWEDEKTSLRLSVMCGFLLFFLRSWQLSIWDRLLLSSKRSSLSLYRLRDVWAVTEKQLVSTSLGVFRHEVTRTDLPQKKPKRKDISLRNRSSLWRTRPFNDGLLCRRWHDPDPSRPSFLQVVVPFGHRASILTKYHDECCHMGKEKTLLRLRSRFHWYGMRHDVVDWVRSCSSCSAHKTPKRCGRGAPLVSTWCGYPWERVAMDLIPNLPVTKRGNRHLLVVVDNSQSGPKRFHCRTCGLRRSLQFSSARLWHVTAPHAPCTRITAGIWTVTFSETYALCSEFRKHARLLIILLAMAWWSAWTRPLRSSFPTMCPAATTTGIRTCQKCWWLLALPFSHRPHTHRTTSCSDGTCTSRQTWFTVYPLTTQRRVFRRRQSGGCVSAWRMLMPLFARSCQLYIVIRKRISIATLCRCPSLKATLFGCSPHLLALACHRSSAPHGVVLTKSSTASRTESTTVCALRGHLIDWWLPMSTGWSPATDVWLTSPLFRKFLVLHLPRRQHYLSHRDQLMCPTLPIFFLYDADVADTVERWDVPDNPQRGRSQRHRCLPAHLADFIVEVQWSDNDIKTFHLCCL